MKKFLMRFKNYQNQFKTEKQSLEHLSRLKFMENSIYKNLIGTPELYQNHQNKFKEFYKEYFPWFVDVWYYLVIIIVFIVCAVIWL